MTPDRRELLLALASGALAGGALAGPQAAQAAEAQEAGEDAMALYRKIPGMKLEGDEVIAMLLYPEFTALDLVGPHHFLATLLGAKVHLVTNQSDLKPVVSDLGLGVAPTTTMADCPKDLTVLFVPGGTDGTLAAARDKATIDFMQDRASRAQYVTSVCTGSLILGVAGLLKGRRATSHWSVRDLLPQFGATSVNERVVMDGNVITGAGVSAGMDFGLWLADKLRGKPFAQAEMLMAEYHPQPHLVGGTVELTPPEVLRPTQALFKGFVDEAKTLRPAKD